MSLRVQPDPSIDLASETPDAPARDCDQSLVDLVIPA